MSQNNTFPPNPGDFFNWVNQMMAAPAKLAAASVPVEVGDFSDPFSFWKNLTEKNQEVLSKYLKELVTTKEFAQSMGQTANSSAAYRVALRKATKAYMEAAGILTVEDLTRLAKLVIVVDEKINEIEVASNENQATLLHALDQLKLEVKKVNGKFDNLDKKLSLHNSESGPMTEVEERLSKVEMQLNRIEKLLTPQKSDNLNNANTVVLKTVKPTASAGRPDNPKPKKRASSPRPN